MRHADTQRLIDLNDSAIRHNFNEWLRSEFFDDVAVEGRHILGLALPHGIRPGGTRPEWPPHFRTVWYTEMRDGDIGCVLIDVLADDLEALPLVPRSPDENPFVGQERFELPPVAILQRADGPMMIDGKHVAAAARARGRDELESIAFPDHSEDEIADLRARIDS